MAYLTLAALLLIAAGLIVAYSQGPRPASPDYGHLTAEVWGGDEA
jgi:hypothetical protein